MREKKEEREKILYVKYMPINVKTICPAVIFAARRNLKVIGRTEILMVSINTRKGFNHLGAPPGSNAAAQEEGLVNIPDIIRASHKGSPITSVNDRCLVALKI